MRSVPVAAIDKVLKRDMTAFFGVRRPLELGYTFLYLFGAAPAT